MEGTLSLFDWRPQPAVESASMPPAAGVLPAAGIVIFDVETTGIDPARDQVIELCVQFGLEGEARTWRIKPSVPISPGAQAVHGIAMADLADCPAFGDVATEIIEVFRTAEVLVGYNLAFDIDMLQAELVRIGRPMLDLTDKKIVDPFRLWQQCEPRSLQHAHLRFVGNEFEAAHSATADVAATGRVLQGMLRALQAGLRGLVADRERVRPAAGGVGELGRPLAPPALGGGRGGRRLRQVRRYPAPRAGGGAGSQLPALDRRAGFSDPRHRGVPRGARAAPETLRAWVKERFGQPAPTPAPPFAK